MEHSSVDGVCPPGTHLSAGPWCPRGLMGLLVALTPPASAAADAEGCLRRCRCLRGPVASPHSVPGRSEPLGTASPLRFCAFGGPEQAPPGPGVRFYWRSLLRRRFPVCRWERAGGGTGHAAGCEPQAVPPLLLRAFLPRPVLSGLAPPPPRVPRTQPHSLPGSPAAHPLPWGPSLG